MQFEQGFLRLSLGKMMSAHDWRDGIGDFCVADYLAELNQVHLVRQYTPNPGCSVVICLEHLRAPGLIDSGFKAQKTADQHTAETTLARRTHPDARLFGSVALRSRSKPLTPPK
jgi:hypothetical protein